MPGDDGRTVAAAMHVNMWDEGIEPLKERVESGEAVAAESLR